MYAGFQSLWVRLIHLVTVFKGCQLSGQTFKTTHETFLPNILDLNDYLLHTKYVGSCRNVQLGLVDVLQKFELYSCVYKYQYKILTGSRTFIMSLKETMTTPMTMNDVDFDDDDHHKDVDGEDDDDDDDYDDDDDDHSG